MANLEKITAGGVTYDLRDASAVHTVDSAMSSTSTNPVQNKVVKQYVDDAIQNEPYMGLAIAPNFQSAILFLYNFKNSPTTYEDLVAHDDFKMALARPIVVHAGAINNPVVQGLVLNMDGILHSSHWTIVFPDGIAFNGMLINGVRGDLTYDSMEGYWYLDNFAANTPEFKNYTDEAITNLSILSTQVESNATEAATPANGDGLIFADSDDANKLKRMTNGFGTSTTTFLRNDGTWAAPPSSEAPVARIFHGTCSVAGTAKTVVCPQFLTSDFVTGAIVFVTFTVTNSGAVDKITLNVNGTGAKNIKYMRNAAESNLPGVGYLRANMTYRFVYNGSYWVCDTDYDADTVTQLTYRTFRVASDAGGSLYSYKLCALDNNGDLIPFNFVSSSPTTAYTKALTTHLFNPFRGFLYYSGTTTTAAGSGRDANEFKSAIQFDCRYSLNINSSGTAGSTALTAYDPIYVKALYTASTRLAKLVADTSNSNYLVRSSVVQALPTADPNTGLVDGTFYIYILLGQAYSKYQINMFDNKIVYYWNTKAGMMTEFTGIIEADYATPADISTAINALDASATGLSASKTITALSETNGVISASASDISIDASQVATGTFASNRIYSDATMATAIETGDSVIFADSSDSNKVKRMSNGFDTTKIAEFLRRDGSWAAPPSGTNTTYTFADGTNGFTVTPSDGTAQTVNVTPSISEIKNDLTLLKEGTSPGDSYSLIFQRGTLTDSYNDWRIQDRGGFLYFDQRGSGSTSWGNMASINTSGTLTASSFSGNGASLTSLNASNISSGTLNAARLPSGLEYTSNKTQTVNSSSTTTEYPSAKAVYDALDAITYKTGDQYYVWTPDQTPATGKLVSGSCSQGTYSDFRNAAVSGKAVFVYDDAEIFDHTGDGKLKLFTLSTDYYETSLDFFWEGGCEDRCRERLTLWSDDTFELVKWSERKITQFYGDCTTAASTAAKVVTVTGDNEFKLEEGVRISVRFTNGSSSTSTMSLNVDGTGAKNCGVYLNNNTWQAWGNRCEKNEVLEFVYNGTYWITLTPYALRNFYNFASRGTSANVSLPNGGLQYFLATSSMTTGRPPMDGPIINMNWDNGNIWGSQLAIGRNSNETEAGRVFTRSQYGTTTWSNWRELPRLSSAPSDGDIIVSDASTGAGLVKGVSTLPTTRLLRPTGENAGTIVSDVTINAQIDNMRANRLAFIPADHIIVERTTDNGATWTAGEYSATDKKHLFAGTRGSRLYIPRINSARNINCGLRLTITAMNYNVPEGTTEANWYQYWNSSYIDSAERYTQLKELYFFVNTVNDGLSCKIEAAKGSSSTTWVTLYDSATTTATPFALTGYTGADYVRLVGGPFTFGGGTTQTGNYWNYRITFFTRDANGGTNLSTSSTDVQQYITQICGYGPVSWTNANRLMYNDHLYRWDQDQNATFPADVTAATFTGDGSNLTSIVSTQIEANATESAAVGTGDGLIFADSDDSNKLKRMTSGFDVSNNTSFLRQDGVWAVPAGGGGGTSGIFKGTCGTGAAGDPKVVQCPEFTSEDLVKGAVIFVTFTYTNSASVNTVQMNVNGTGAKRIMQRKNTVVGTMTTNGEILANQTYMFTYDGTYWVLSNDDDRTNVTALGDGFKNIGTTYRYQFLVSCPKDDTNATDHKRALFAINAVNSGSATYTKAFRTWSFDPFGVFAYWNSTDTVSSEGTFGDPARLQIECKISANYAFNVKQNGTAGTQGLVDNKAVYMKSKYDFVTQSATLWQDTASANYLDRSGLVQELPTTNPNTSTDTYVYIYLGQAYGGDARTFYLLPYHPVYMWNEAKGRMDLFTGGPMEGSGTCTISDGSGTSFTANYYKVGQQVTVSGTIPSVGSTATALVGLPFAPIDNVQTTLTWTDSSLMSMVVARLSIASGSKNITPMGYAKVGVSSTSNAGSWLSQIPSAGVPFNVTYVTDVP